MPLVVASPCARWLPACPRLKSTESVGGSQLRDRRARAGFSLVEVLLVIVLVGVLVRAGASGVRALKTQQGGERVGRALLWEAKVARTYAIRYGLPLSFVADKANRRLITRDGYGHVYRTVSFGPGTDLMATSLFTNVTGDSLVFSGHGYCLNCGDGSSTGTTAFSIVSNGRTYAVTVNPLGRAEMPSLPGF